MDDLHQEMFTALLSPDWSHGVEPAVDLSAQNPCDLDLRQLVPLRQQQHFLVPSGQLAQGSAYQQLGLHPSRLAHLCRCHLQILRHPVHQLVVAVSSSEVVADDVGSDGVEPLPRVIRWNGRAAARR